MRRSGVPLRKKKGRGKEHLTGIRGERGRHQKILDLFLLE